MATLIGCLAMSHGPQLMITPDKWGVLHTREWDLLPVRPDLEQETLEIKWAKWRRCMKAIDVLRRKLEEFSPDVLLVVGDDQHENILEDNTPPFTIYIGEEVEASTNLKYFNEPKSANRVKHKVHVELAESILNDLMEAGFDPAYSKKTRYEGGLGHAFARPLKFLMPAAQYPIVPIMVNTYYPPAPSARRCVQLGKALASALRAHKGSRRVAILGSGGLTHTKIDEHLDQSFLQALEKSDIEYLSRMASEALIEGTSEIRNWIVTAAAANSNAKLVDYQPLYRTPTGVGCAMGFAYWDTPASVEK
jgi:aromatic ring-opening dioxygenase catalytic subunit (LigB family)